MSLAIYRRAALVSLSLLIMVYLLYSLTRLPEQRTLALLLTTLPLAFPISGTLSAKRYTIAYSSLLSTWYFCLSGWLYIVHLDWVRWVMLAGVMASLLWFFACLMLNKKK